MYNLKITFRRLIKDKTFLLINVFGLVIGISSFLILFIHVSNEKSFDKHISGHENIYRIKSTPSAMKNFNWACSMGIIHPFSSEIPEVELATHFWYWSDGTIKIGNNSFTQNDIMAVDESFIEMFEVKFKVGNLSELETPNAVFISEDFARKHYGDLNPVGQTIKIEALHDRQNVGDYVVCGIVGNTHLKTHFRYELLLSQKGNLQKSFEKSYTYKSQGTYNYFKLQKDASPQMVAQKLTALWDKSSLKQKGGHKEYDFSLFPIDDIHLKSDFRFELRESSSKINISLFIIVSFVILMVSLLNFTNLTISKLINRSKELGLKRFIGANSLQIIVQVLVEVLIVCIVSICFSLLLIRGIEPLINQLFDIEFKIFYNEPVIYWSIIVIIAVSLTITAFFVAVFFLSKKSSIDILAKRNNFSGSYVLKSLLIGQVAIVIILISGTFLVNKQIDYIFNKPLGYNKENIVVLHLKDFSKDPTIFTRELEKQTSVESTGFTRQYFGYPTGTFPLDGLGVDGSVEFVNANYDYLKTMNIKLIENWINPSAEVVQGIVINNHLYKRLMKQHGSIEALHAYQESQVAQLGQENYQVPKVIGVTEDFNYNSAHENIGDFAFSLDESRNRARFIHVRLGEGSLHTSMDAIKRVWNEYYPNQEMNSFFIDEKIAQQYKAETILMRILSTFSGIGVLISIIGISALALFISQQRTKEIGVRKVNGAKVSEILTLLNKGFIKWVAIAFLIACPVAWFTMNKWLENFAYKTTLSWWIFVLAGGLTLGITLLTVSWQSWRAANRNPVEALRYE